MSRAIRNVVVMTLCAVVLMLWRHGDFFFGPPHVEMGDFASNAIKIEDAHHLRTIHGNYSQWEFSHPGPAFLYVYAGAEVLFHRWCGWMASPHQAHVLGGVVLQALCFATALQLLARALQCRRFLPLAIFVTAEFLLHVNGSLSSIWPPHALLGPFFLFLAAGTSLAVGRTVALVPLVAAGWLLMHGHVAQPLFVVSGFLFAYGVWSRRCRQDGGVRPWLAAPAAHAWACGLGLLFALPLIIDVLRWEDSNISKILWHVGRHASEHKTFSQAVAQYLSFFVRDPSPEISVAAPGFSLAGYVLAHWAALAAWALMAALAVAGVRLEMRRDGDGCRASRAMLAAWGAATVLALVWGVKQNGPLFAYNSHFVNALLLWIVLIAVVPLSRALDKNAFGGVAAAGALVLSVACFALVPRGPVFSQPETAPELPANLRAALARGGEGPVHLHFDRAYWPDAIAVALELKREGTGFTIDDEVGFLFGKAYVRKAAPPARAWKIVAMRDHREAMPLTSRVGCLPDATPTAKD